MEPDAIAHSDVVSIAMFGHAMQQLQADESDGAAASAAGGAAAAASPHPAATTFGNDDPGGTTTFWRPDFANWARRGIGGTRVRRGPSLETDVLGCFRRPVTTTPQPLRFW